MVRCRCTSDNASVIDQYIDMPEFRQRFLHDTLQLAFITEIRNNRMRLSSKAFYLLLHITASIIACYYSDIRSSTCQSKRNTASQTFGSSRDQSRFTGKIKQLD
jgi:hypothetical protein